MLRSYRPAQHRLLIFSREDNVPSIRYSEELGLFEGQTPSLGEITYFAFGIPSVEFHDELWGEIQVITKRKSEWSLNVCLHDTHKLSYDKEWNRDNRPNAGPEDATLPYYIRNSIHHPENRLNDPFTYDELTESTESLITVLKTLQSTQVSNP